MTHAAPYAVTLPTDVTFGIDSRLGLGKKASRFGGSAFVMVDPFLKGSAVEAELVMGLAAEGVTAQLWHDIVPNPRAATCDAGAALATSIGAEMIVALGGGSTIDAAKAVALVATNGGSSWDFTLRTGAQVRIPDHPGLPLIAIPTNAGTGAEVTPFAVLSNPALKLKATIIHPFCHPNVALIDPRLHLTKPARLTASTGVDTFLHAFEGFIGNRPNTWTDLFSIRAMELVAENLALTCHQPGNLTARSRMAEACYMAGITLGNIGVGIPHALGQALGALKDTPHGESCAACLIPTLRWTLPYASERLARTARIFRPELVAQPQAMQAAALPDILGSFFAEIGLTGGFGALGLSHAEIEPLVDVALHNYGFDIACSTRPATRDDLRAIVADSL